ncbi:F0F1 ATP synthase subunit delta [Marinicella sp. W31]|uniref:F0F1 ATP synthase subunit delta n=1 Tax=Marinicella sp. W31 TaxID=3023713 RepID=UPI0037576396
MSDLITLARPYAKAAFEFAKDANVSEPWARALTVAGALTTQQQVKSLITGPSVEVQDVVKLLADEAADEGFVHFIHILHENDRLQLLPEIAQLYAQYLEEDSRSLTVEVASATPMDAEQQAALVQSLSERIGKTITLDLQVDESLLGGARIQYGDVVIDGTLKSKLAELKSNLLH